MNKIQEQVQEFHEKFGVPVGDYPQRLHPKRVYLRTKLIEEEFKEFKEAVFSGELYDIADALGDLLYVTFGTAVEMGFDMEPIMDEIQRSNLSKLFPDGPHHREDGKVLKGPNFTLPDLKTVLIRQGASFDDGDANSAGT